MKEELIERSGKLTKTLIQGVVSDGVVILAGKKSNEAFSGSTLQDLKEELGDSVNFFDYRLLDFHPEGRRSRMVTVVIRKGLMEHDASITPRPFMNKFLGKLPRNSHRRIELNSFLVRQSKVLIALSEGEVNQTLYAFLVSHMTSSGRPLTAVKVPIHNLHHTGVSRKNPQDAYVYMTV